jgi:hypothetical protein
MRNILALLAIVAILGLNSCKKDKDPAGCSANWAQELLDEYSNVLTTSTTYENDPTQENCLAYKDALQDYVDAVEPLLSCSLLTAEEQQELEEDLEDTEDEISTLCTE